MLIFFKNSKQTILVLRILNITDMSHDCNIYHHIEYLHQEFRFDLNMSNKDFILEQRDIIVGERITTKLIAAELN